MTLRCRPGDLCIIVPGQDEITNSYMRDLFGMIVTVTDTCPGNPTGWHYKGDPLVVKVQDNHYLIHAIPDENLKPIRGETLHSESFKDQLVAQ